MEMEDYQQDELSQSSDESGILVEELEEIKVNSNFDSQRNGNSYYMFKEEEDSLLYDANISEELDSRRNGLENPPSIHE